MTAARVPSRLVSVRRFVTRDVNGGLLLVGAALLGLVLANSPWHDIYRSVADFKVGPAWAHLDLPLTVWAADGLLAVFFFVVGLELKHELVAGSLRRPREAAVPVLAAVGGMVVPALIFSAVVIGMGEPGALVGWAVPTATDIAFALAVLAVFGQGLPRELRTFLLTLAVVDDLLAIIVIAVFYTAQIDLWMLLAAFAVVAVFAVAVRSRRWSWLVLVPLGLLAWVLMHASGVHATIAGVLLGLVVPARPRPGESEPRTHRLEAIVRPWSAGVALPLFAFFAAGVTVVGGAGATMDLPVLIGVGLGLVAGKLVGVLGATALAVRFTPLRLPDAIGLRDLLPVGFLCAIGFTVSLLITELSFEDEPHLVAAKVGILGASLLAAVLGALTLRWDSRQVRRSDMNEDGMVDSTAGAIGDPDDDN